MPPGVQAFGGGMGVVSLNTNAPTLVLPEAPARPSIASGEGGSSKTEGRPTAHATGSSGFFGLGGSLIRVSNCAKGPSYIVHVHHRERVARPGSNLRLCLEASCRVLVCRVDLEWGSFVVFVCGKLHFAACCSVLSMHLSSCFGFFLCCCSNLRSVSIVVFGYSYTSFRF